MSRKLKQVISCQSFSPISDVRDGIIVTKDGKFVKLMEFSPINYGLRSNEDKNMITAQYAAAIRSFPSVVQIKVLSNRANVEHYISGMVESVRHEKNEGTRELMREQIDMMSEFGASQGVSRRFFLAFQYEEEEGFAHRSPSWNEIRSTITRQEDAIRSNLRACGNIMISRPHDDVYVLSTLYDMLYEAPVDNLKCLMRSCTVLSRSGLYRFFSSQLTQAQVDFLINALASQRVLDIDEQDYELIWFHRMGLKTSRLRPEYVKAKIRAFWVIARVGCDAILDVTSLDHPMQFSFIANTLDENGEERYIPYDIAVCNTVDIAKAVVYKRSKCERSAIEEEATHIALVNNKETGEAIMKECLDENSRLYRGFDCFCTLDNNNIPRYVSW